MSGAKSDRSNYAVAMSISRSLRRRLDDWLQAGLLDPEAVARIEQHEAERGSDARPMLLWALAGLGGLAVSIGLISLVAANWSEIPASGKLAADLCLGVLLALGLGRQVVATSHSAASDAAPNAATAAAGFRDALVLVYSLFTLSSLALVGQIYQLGGGVTALLSIWTLATAPLVLLLGRGRMLAVVWLSGLLATYAALVVDLAAALEHGPDGGRRAGEAVGVAIGLLPAALIGVARIEPWRRAKPQFSAIFAGAGWLGVGILGFGFTLVWYEDVPADAFERSALLCAVIWAGLAALVPWLYPDHSPRAQLGLRATLLGIAALGVFSLTVPHAESGLTAALLGLIVLALFAWTALQMEERRLFHLLTAAIGLRLLVIYFEVFGSLLQTGLGLLSGGLLTLLLTWLWFRHSPAWAEPGSSPGPHSDPEREPASTPTPTRDEPDGKPRK